MRSWINVWWRDSIQVYFWFLLLDSITWRILMEKKVYLIYISKMLRKIFLYPNVSVWLSDSTKHTRWQCQLLYLAYVRSVKPLFASRVPSTIHLALYVYVCGAHIPIIMDFSSSAHSALWLDFFCALFSLTSRSTFRKTIACALQFTCFCSTEKIAYFQKKN